MAQQKQTVVSFRVDHHLAEILNNLPDKSAFIREAILRRFHTECPFCRGRGVLPGLIAEWFETQLPRLKTIECKCCNYRYPVDILPPEALTGPGDDFVCSHCREHGHVH
ncbi:MAG: hypothetical protein HY718_13635 [Planctomycetes bacterium]|nr:hypothetical protein [Planctomycetota bacterium]